MTEKTHEQVISDVYLEVKALKIEDYDYTKLAVKRVSGGVPTENCFDFTPVELPTIIHRTATDHGTGQYQIWVRGEKGISKRISFDITQKIQNQPANFQNQQGKSDFERLEQLFNSKIGQLHQKIDNKNQNQNQNQNQLDPIEVVKLIQETQKTERENAREDRKQERLDFEARNSQKEGGGQRLIKETLEEIKAIKEFEAETGIESKVGNPIIENLMQAFTANVHHLQPLAEGYKIKQQNDQTEIILKHQAEIAEIYLKNGKTPPDPATSPAAGPAPAPAAGPAPAPAAGTETAKSEQEEVDEYQKKTIAHLKELEEAAANGGNPVTYAEMTIDKFGDEIVCEWLEIPGIIDQMISLNPNLQHYKKWLENVLQSLDDMYDAPKKDDEKEEKPATAGAASETKDGSEVSNIDNEAPGAA